MLNWQEAKYLKDADKKKILALKEDLQKVKLQRRADLLYPTMKEKNQEGTITGGAAKIADTKNSEKKESVSAKNKDVKSDEEKNRDIFKILGMDEKEYQIKGNTISKKEKTKDYEIINNVKYPANTDNEEVEKQKQKAKENRSERLREDNTEYLKHNVKLEQFGVDHVDNKFVKEIDKWRSGTDEAVENLHMSKKDSYLNTDYAKKHKVLNTYKE